MRRVLAALLDSDLSLLPSFPLGSDKSLSMKAVTSHRTPHRSSQTFFSVQLGGSLNGKLSGSGHFGGKSVPEHLKEARKKGAMVAAEVHGTETPGHVAAFADSARETAVLFVLLWIALTAMGWELPQLLKAFALFSVGLLLWKTGRSALLGWSRLNKLHRLIEEERWEIEHHRAQEKEELKELYAAKGFSGRLLDEVVEVLMADDNRLLQIMLEEELGLTTEAFEHPLKQSLGAALGVITSSLFSLFLFSIYPAWGLPLAALLTFLVITPFIAKRERAPVLPLLVWSLALAALACGVTYFLL